MHLQIITDSDVQKVDLKVSVNSFLLVHAKP